MLELKTTHSVSFPGGFLSSGMLHQKKKKEKDAALFICKCKSWTCNWNQNSILWRVIGVVYTCLSQCETDGHQSVGWRWSVENGWSTSTLFYLSRNFTKTSCWAESASADQIANWMELYIHRDNELLAVLHSLPNSYTCTETPDLTQASF